MSEREWLDGLRLGDRVLVEGRYGFNSGTVARSAPTLVSVMIGAGTTNFRRKDGFQCGSHKWTSMILREPTPERLDEIQRAENRRRVSDIRTAKLTDDQVARICAILREPKDIGGEAGK